MGGGNEEPGRRDSLIDCGSTAVRNLDECGAAWLTEDSRPQVGRTGVSHEKNAVDRRCTQDLVEPINIHIGEPAGRKWSSKNAGIEIRSENSNYKNVDDIAKTE